MPLSSKLPSYVGSRLVSSIPHYLKHNNVRSRAAIYSLRKLFKTGLTKIQRRCTRFRALHVSHSTTAALPSECFVNSRRNKAVTAQFSQPARYMVGFVPFPWPSSGKIVESFGVRCCSFVHAMTLATSVVALLHIEGVAGASFCRDPDSFFRLPGYW